MLCKLGGGGRLLIRAVALFWLDGVRRQTGEDSGELEVENTLEDGFGPKASTCETALSSCRPDVSS